MAKIDLVMPKMGESIMEATILNWVKKVGDKIEEDETIVEIATDKVDSEIPSPVNGVIAEILHQVNDTVEVGVVIARIETEADAEITASPAVIEPEESTPLVETKPEPALEIVQEELQPITGNGNGSAVPRKSNGRFYSPLVRNIAKQEEISVAELDQIKGSGAQGRVTKKDIFLYVKNKGVTTPVTSPPVHIASPSSTSSAISSQAQTTTNHFNGKDEIIEMDRMRKMIADHMVMSKQTSPHVTSFVEADVTNLVNWRNAVKESFQKDHGEKITFTPIFIDAVIKALKDFPMVNVSVEGNKIIKKGDMNIGMATALPSGNLIVPVIKNADNLSMVGLTKTVNDLARRARNNGLKPEEIQGGTFTITNVGTFGNVMGTPIINQPQVAILATGAIRKKPAVVETEYGDLITIRQMMFLSLSYDHRVVDGLLGGSFLRRIADYLEQFDSKQSI